MNRKAGRILAAPAVLSGLYLLALMPRMTGRPDPAPFRTRLFAHRGLHRLQAEHWSLEDWKREIDWIVKRRMDYFMLRTGMDDLFQRAFPDVCPYPDASKPQPGMYKGYNDRTLFWSLQFRGKLCSLRARLECAGAW